MARTGLVAGIVMAGLALSGLPVGLAYAGDMAPELHDEWFKNANPKAAPPPVVQFYDPDPAIWELSDEDTTIYLFGTFHALPTEFRWRSPQFNQIVADADELVVESSDAALADDGVEAVMVKMYNDLPKRAPTSSKLSPESAEKWLKVLKSSGMPVPFMDRMPPMMALMTIGVGFSMEAGSTSDNGVETILEAEFAKAGKPVGSIEDPVPVLQGLLTIDEDLLVAQLEQDLADWDGKSFDTFMVEPGEAEDASAVDLFAMEHAWARGQIPDGDMFGDTPLDDAMRKVLLTDRNRAWAVWLDERLDRPGTVLVAVGAGHFEGRVSVLKMLADRGLTARRIN